MKGKPENAPASWPASHTEQRALASLIPYARNARKHSKEQVAKIARAIQEWGWTNPVLVAEDGTIIAGHGRVLAAKSLGITEVPVMVARGWTDAQRRAYVIADNRIAEEAGWDRDVLALEFAELEALDFDLSLTGFDTHEKSEGSADVSSIELPKPVRLVWALIGVPVESMGELSMMIEKAQTIDGAMVEVCEEK